VEEFGLSSKGSAVLNRLMEMGMTQEEAMQRISEMAQSGSYDLGNIALMDRAIDPEMTREQQLDMMNPMPRANNIENFDPSSAIKLMDRESKMDGGMMIIGHNDVANSGIADILEKYRAIRSNL
jgi:hypothetical protein